MKRFMILIILGAVSLSLGPAVHGADEKKERRRREVVVVPQLEGKVEQLRERLEGLQHRRWDHIRHLQDLDLRINLPDIERLQDRILEEHLNYEFNFDPEFEVIGPDGGLILDGPDNLADKFGGLSEEEEIRLQAMRSIARQDAQIAVPALKKVLDGESHPAFSYQAVRYLGYFMDEDERVIPMLGDVATSGGHVAVRKLAVRLLGQSEDPRAVPYLEKILQSGK